MPKYEVTEQLSSAIRTVRLQNNIKATDVAREIGKTSAFISKLENGSLKTIKSEDLHNIVIFLSKDDDRLDDIFISLLSSANLNYTKKESEQEEWILNLDYFYRKFNIPVAYVNYVNEYMDSHNISVPTLTKYINKNSDLYDNPSLSDTLIHSSEKNHWYFNNGNSYIVMDVKDEDIDKILNKTKKVANYSLLLCIVFSLYKLTGIERTDASKKAKETLMSSLSPYEIFCESLSICPLSSPYSRTDLLGMDLSIFCSRDRGFKELFPITIFL